MPKNPHSTQSAPPPGHRPYVVLAVDHYHPQVHAGVVRAAREFGWDLDASMARWRSLPQDVTPDGILLTASEPRMLDWTAQFSCPVVHLHSLRRMPGKEPVTVQLDYAAAGRMGAQHLLETGSLNYAFFRRYPAMDSILMRDAFLEEIASAGYRPLRLDMPDEMPDMQAIHPIQRARRIEWLAQRLPGLPRPIAIMAEEDRFAVDLILAALRVGLRVPEDIAVLGSEDDPLEYGLSPVSVSSVECRLEASGAVAAACLRELMAGRHLAARELLLPPLRVTARRSTDFFNHPNPRIAAAILHLRRNYRETIGTETLARIAAVSRRRLQDVIKSVTGRTLTDELARLRLMHAEKLLRTTDLKLLAIAYESGLGQDKNLIRLFQKKHGLSPGAWREIVKSGRLP
jgi:LacI family transcriptional regulator